MVSRCCSTEVYIDGQEDHHYYCEECLSPCDLRELSADTSVDDLTCDID